MNGPDPSERWRDLDRLADGSRRGPTTSAPEPTEPSPYESYPWSAVGGPPPLPTYPTAYGPLSTPVVSGALPLRHPSASVALTLGVLGAVGGPVCYLPLLASPFALVLGRRAMREIDASAGALTGRGAALSGVVLGALGSAFLVFVVVALVVYVAS